MQDGLVGADDGMEELEMALPHQQAERDLLKITFGVAAAIYISGVLASVVGPVFAGAVLFLMLSNHAFMPGVTYMGYLSPVGPQTAVAAYYIVLFLTVISAMYTFFACLYLSNNVPKALFGLATGTGLVTFIVNFYVWTLSGTLDSMQRRNPTWWVSGQVQAPVVGIHAACEIVCAIFAVVHGLVFAVGFNMSKAELRRWFVL
jgi:hypothetical protein